MRKVPVGVLTQFDSAGEAHPLSVTWEDGRVYPIESVLEMRPAKNAPLRFRYTVLIYGHETYLYRTGDQWHMDGVE